MERAIDDVQPPKAPERKKAVSDKRRDWTTELRRRQMKASLFRSRRSTATPSLSLTSLTAGTNEHVRLLGTLTTAITAAVGGWIDNPDDDSYDNDYVGTFDTSSDADWNSRTISQFRFIPNSRIVIRRNPATGAPFGSGDAASRIFVLTETPDGTRRHHFDGRNRNIESNTIAFDSSVGEDFGTDDIGVDYPVGTKILIVIADEGSVQLATDES